MTINRRGFFGAGLAVASATGALAQKRPRVPVTAINDLVAKASALPLADALTQRLRPRLPSDYGQVGNHG